MNKLLKGSIAGAAGIALLLGGAGTLAYWNDSATLTNAGTITAGKLVITDAGTGVWTDQDADIVDLASYVIVPGDVLTFKQTLEIEATGDNLVATVGLTDGAITAASAAAADVALAAALQDSSSFTVDTASTTVVTANAGAQDVEVSVTITFPAGIAGEFNSAQLGAVDLTAFALNLTQTV